ncbi:hypothetical protein OJ996_01490 [Luteolibacter sp. GHJ8]|uniref:DUF4034 domain-containing protein n=1 Tax=Luteolibacter rhizosphaerae TaxID=2989719 RepID=A0ABT3FY73_9BACT|nr:hypothetical protein [Luteolibacter rhizosphaerae]MCW1912226.1 hypothetical protein [Luteolibacter rhizosphaerae]
MRTRGYLILALLPLSHATAWWMGGRWPDANHASGPSKKHAEEADASRWSVAELLRRGRPLDEAARANIELGFEERLKAARDKIPQDADLSALIARCEAALAEDKQTDADLVAAFGFWIDRDPDGALAWLSRFSKEEPDYYLSGQLTRYLGEGGHSRLNQLLAELPRLRKTLLKSAQDLAMARGGEFTLALARTLTTPDDRFSLLNHVFQNPELARGHLASARAMMNDRQASEFIGSLINGRMWVLAEEVMAAGFPEEQLRWYEEQAPGWKLGDERQRLAKEQYAATPLEEKMRGYGRGENHEQRSHMPWQQDFHRTLPDFLSWCYEVKEGRSTPDEVLTRVKAAWPEAASVDRELRSYIFDQVFWNDPVEHLQWIRQTGGEEWQKDVLANLVSLTPEQIRSLMESDSRLEFPRELPRGLHYSFLFWNHKDPEGCVEAIRDFPDEELRAQLLKVFGREDGP